MSRRIDHDGRGGLEVRFPFDRRLVDAVKSLPGRRWAPDDKLWRVPDTEVVAVVDLLADEGFRIDDATRRLYAESGGRRRLDPTAGGPASPGSGMRSLFDPPASAPDDPAPDDGLTVSRLNREVAAAIAGLFPSSVWVLGEISGFDKNAHRRHVGFQLVERDDSGREIAQVNAILFEGVRRTIAGRLEAAGRPFELGDEITVRMRARVELYEPWGQYRVRIEDLDVGYTLGEAARRREEIVRRLAAEGLLERNTALAMPPLPLRVGLITSLGSDAYNDVLRTLEESGYAFEVTAHGARVQGRHTEGSVLNALDWFRDRAERFDVVMICRGGGSRTDLAWFDSEPLGRAVATFPIPVVVGIGHEQDRSVLDDVGWSAKTPTAAAAGLVERVAASLERLLDAARAILGSAADRVSEAGRSLGNDARRLAVAARHLLERADAELEHGRRRAIRGLRGRLAAAEGELRRGAATLPRLAAALLARRDAELERAAGQILRGCLRDTAAAARRIDDAARGIGPRAGRAARLETERLAARERRLHLVDPRRVIERGYAVLRVGSGRVLTRAVDAPAGTAVAAVLRDGRLRLRSEGPSAEKGD